MEGLRGCEQGRRVLSMKQLLLICAVVALVGGCGGKKDDGNTGVVNPNKPSPKAVPEKLITDPIVEKAIRKGIYKRTGELTEADLDKATSLILSYNELTEVPKGLENLNQLTSLHLWNNQLTDVKGLEKLTQLETLNLQDNKLTDIKGLEKLTQLKSLRLEDNQLTDVKGLEKLTKLEELYLGGNPDLTKAQIDELQKALPNCRISSNPTK